MNRKILTTAGSLLQQTPPKKAARSLGEQPSFESPQTQTHGTRM